MRIVFDLEGNGLYDTVDTLWCYTHKVLETGEICQWNVTESKNDGKSITETTLKKVSTEDEYIGQNIIGFDLPVLKKVENWQPPKGTSVTDTLVMSRLLNPDRLKPHGYDGKAGPHSVECYGYLFGRPKPDHEDWTQYTPAMLHRNEEDVEITVMMYHHLNAEMGDWDWSEALRIEHEIARIISRQERYGILFDEQRAREYVSDLTLKIEAIDEEIVPKLPKTLKKIGSVPVNNPFLKTGGYRKQTLDYLDEAYKDNKWRLEIVGGPFSRIDFIDFNLGSTEKVKEFLLDSGWRPEHWNYSTKTGERTSPKLEGDFLGVRGDIPRKVKERIIWRHRKSQIVGWLERLREDGRLSAGANPCGTNTGRMRHHTVVNIPKANHYKESHLKNGTISTQKMVGQLIWKTEHQKDTYGTQMRSLFIAPPGYKLVGHDASGLELRMLAHYMGDEEFTKQVIEGDVHEYNRKLAGLPDRDAAKTFIYAFIYGAGDEKIGAIIGGTADDGAELKRRFLRAIPKLEKLINSVKRASGKGYLKGLDGRKVWMRRDDHGRIKRSKALNTLLQSAGAIVMKQSCIFLWEDVEAAGLQAYKVLDMHDEGQAEVIEKDIEPYCELAVNSIIKAGEYFKLNVPLAAEAKVGNNMAETH